MIVKVACSSFGGVASSPLLPMAVSLILSVSYILFLSSLQRVLPFQKPEVQGSCLSFLSLILSTLSCHNLLAAPIYRLMAAIVSFDSRSSKVLCHGI